MKVGFVRIYLLTVAIVLAVTAAAKWPAIFHERTWCTEDAILGNFQRGLPNEQLLGAAAAIELFIVLLIYLSPWRWLPCIASAAWGLACFVARLFLMDPDSNCRCLDWLMKPSPTTNMMIGGLALLLAGGGWVAFRLAWLHEKQAKSSATQSHA